MRTRDNNFATASLHSPLHRRRTRRPRQRPTVEARSETRTPSAVRPEDIQADRGTIQWPRKFFHAAMGCTILGTYGLTSLTPLAGGIIMSVIAAIILTFDLLRFYVPSFQQRCMKDFLPLMREDEINGLSAMVGYSIGATLSIFLFPKPIALLAVAYLGFGDPIASIVGIRAGRIRLGRKSLEGSLACFGLCALVGLGTLVGFTGLSLAAALPIALFGGICGALAEFVPSWRFDDNFVIPVLSGALLYAAALFIFPAWPII